MCDILCPSVALRIGYEDLCDHRTNAAPKILSKADTVVCITENCITTPTVSAALDDRYHRQQFEINYRVFLNQDCFVLAALHSLLSVGLPYFDNFRRELLLLPFEKHTISINKYLNSAIDHPTDSTAANRNRA
eukprot:IDg7510t1